ncbi:MAG TPA: helix-turn-helix domain-containing protein [Thermomicrobiales bacterium]|jgi:DNA-binding IclR family transcriptional regulator
MAHWTFLSNHAQVLICVARNERPTAKEIAAVVGITERAVQRLLDDLEEGGYLSRYRDGRNNRYEIHAELPLRHPAQEGYGIRDLLELFTPRRNRPDGES